MGTKNNPGPFDCYAKADPDEPLFILRAKDPLAPALVRMWAHVREVYDGRLGLIDSRKYLEAHDCAREMENWRAKNIRQLPPRKTDETFTEWATRAGLLPEKDIAVTACVCGHVESEHNILQDYAGPGLPAHPIEYRHCKVCACPKFQRPNM